MASISIDLADDIESSSDNNETDISFSSVPSVSSASCTSSSTSLYAVRTLELLLRTEKNKYCILDNERTKNSPSWWRSFGFPAAVNEKGDIERIHGYISCKKCYRTSVYGSKSGTKRFIEHANRCSPSQSQSNVNSNGTSGSQGTLDKILLKNKVTITAKEQNELKGLYAKWICEDLRPYSIVEDNGFKKLAQSFIRLGKQKRFLIE